MTSRTHWTAQDLADKGYAEVLGKFCKQVGGTAQRSAMTHWKDSPEATESPMRKISGSEVNPRLAPSPYKSKLEAAWAEHLKLKEHGKFITGWQYEPHNIRLPGKKNFYKPDFLEYTEGVIMGWGLVYYEVKGRNMSDDRSLVKMKTAAGLTPWAKFILVKRINGQWKETVIE